MRLAIKPGVVKDAVGQLPAGLATDSDQIRWRNGQPESLPGWRRSLEDVVLLGVPRAAYRWNDNAGTEWRVFGTDSHLYAVQDDLVADITPLKIPPYEVVGDVSTVDGDETLAVEHAGHPGLSGDTVVLVGTVPGTTLCPQGTLTDPFSVSEGSPLVLVRHDSHGFPPCGGVVRLTAAAAVGGITIDGVFGVSVIDEDTYYIQVDVLPTGTADGGGSTDWIGGVEKTLTKTGADSWTVQMDDPATATGTTAGPGLLVLYNVTPGPSSGVLAPGFGAGPYGVGPYGVSDAQMAKADYRIRCWSLSKWGEKLAICPMGRGLFLWGLNLSARALPISGAPAVVDFMCVTEERHMMAFGCTMTDGTYDPLGIRWCDQMVETSWTPSDTNLAGEDRLSEGSEIRGARSEQSGVYVWTDLTMGVIRATGTVDQYYKAETIGTKCGLGAPNAVIVKDGAAWWYAPSGGFFSYTGSVPSPLECPNVRWLKDSVGRPNIDKSYAVHDGAYSAITWVFPGAGGEPSFYLRLDTKEQVDVYCGWSVGTTRFSAMAVDGSFGADSSGRMYDIDGTDLGDDGSPLGRFVEFAPQPLSEDDMTYTRRIRRVAMVHDIQGSLTMSIVTKEWPSSTTAEVEEFVIEPGDTYVDLHRKARMIGFRFESGGANDRWRVGSAHVTEVQGPRR